MAVNAGASAPEPAAPAVYPLLAWVERVGNRLPHPFWLFLALIGVVAVLSAALAAADVHVRTPELHVLRTPLAEDAGGGGTTIRGRPLTAAAATAGVQLTLPSAARNARLDHLFVEVRRDASGARGLDGEPEGALLGELAIDRTELAALQLDAARLPALAEVDEGAGHHRVTVVQRSREVRARNLLSADGLRMVVLDLVRNFAHFEPLGLVLVMLMGVAIAEGAGLVPAVMRAVAHGVPAAAITPVLFALAACGNIGSDAGIVVIPPLAATIYAQLGRSPIVGLLVGYVGATAGFTANLLPAGTDVLAAALTNAATGGEPEVSVLGNWYFMAASVPFLALVGTWVTRRFVEPRLPAPAPAPLQASTTAPREADAHASLSPRERRGVRAAGLAVLIVAALWSLTIVPAGAPLRDPDPELLWSSPFFKGLIPVLFTLFAAGGVAYGRVAGTITRADDVLGFMSDAMKRMAGYIVLVFAIAQFTALFQWTRIDQLVAIGGAEGLRALGVADAPAPFFVAFVVLVATANLFMGSASAKWAIFAPIFVPMCMSLGVHPAFTQLLYRVGDSITNCVSPLYPYFPLLLGWIAEHDRERARVGTVLSYLTPYAIALLPAWIALLLVWWALGLPIGPGAAVTLP